VESGDFKVMYPMADRTKFLCVGCHHTTMPGDAEYECNCEKCAALGLFEQK
jgi:hypothetical protein